MEDIAEENNIESQGVPDSRKRTAEESMNVTMKRMAMNTGGESIDKLTPLNNSVEMAALQERVRKLERMYQRACRTTREAEIRAERAEKINAAVKSEGPRDGGVPEVKVEVKHEITEPPVDNSMEITALQEQVKEMERMLEEACRRAREAELRAERAEKIIGMEMVGVFSEELEKAKKMEETTEDKKVIDEMKKKLAEADEQNDALRARITELEKLMCEPMRKESFSKRDISDHSKRKEAGKDSVIKDQAEAMEGDKDAKEKKAPTAKPIAAPAESSGILSRFSGWNQPLTEAAVSTIVTETEVEEEIVEEGEEEAFSDHMRDRLVPIDLFASAQPGYPSIYQVHMMDVPYSLVLSDILSFFEDLPVVSVLRGIEGKFFTGDALVHFASADHAKAALDKQTKQIKGRSVRLFGSSERTAGHLRKLKFVRLT